MKKLAFVCAIALILSLLLVCCNMQPKYPLKQDVDRIATIEIVEIDNYKIIDTKSFHLITSCATIAPEDREAFLSDFYDLTCRESMRPPEEYVEGVAIRFTYQDGAFELVSATPGFYYSADQQSSYTAYYLDYDAFNEFISRYYTQEQ